MTPDEAYRSKLRVAIASIRYWVPQINDAARVDETETPEYWKLAVHPLVPGACPFEIILRLDGHYGIVVASETFEDLPITSFDNFLPMVQAIADGRVVQHRWASAATGGPLAIETVLHLGTGKEWRQGTGLGQLATQDGTVRHDTHFLPYRR
jgi:hypothetical protein